MATHDVPADAGILALLASLDRPGEPRLAFVQRAPRRLESSPGTLLCLSASFNPLTVAHLRLIEEAGRLAPPDEVLLVLARANVDKPVEGFPLARRLAILSRFAETRSTYSIAAASHGRFVDKARAILPHYPAGTRLVFVVGFDTLLRLFDPKYYDDRDAALASLFSTCEFIAANRAPEPPEALTAFLARPEVAPFSHAIRRIRLPGDIAAVSATKVRARLASGLPVADLVPPEIQPLIWSVPVEPDPSS
jgi:nicotinamide-nucleotide adenylyltransferase